MLVISVTDIHMSRKLPAQLIGNAYSGMLVNSEHNDCLLQLLVGFEKINKTTIISQCCAQCN